MRDPVVAVIGATGAVGRELLQILAERRFPLAELRLGASQGSAGQTLPFDGRELSLAEVTPAFFRGVDLAFTAVSADVARTIRPWAADAGTVVIDKSSAFRMDPAVPLVVPEVNGDALRGHEGLIASPNCSTIQLVVALHPLRAAFGLRRVIVSTYQSVSGTGREAMAELRHQSAAVLAGQVPRPAVYERPIAFNVLPKVDAFDDHGFSGEEQKLVRETRKIFGDPSLAVAATAVRVPVLRGHAEAVTAELGRPVSVAEVEEALLGQPGLRYYRPPDYPTPLDADGDDLVHVGRLRRDLDREDTVHLFVISDNLRKGAATNAVQIAERLLAEGWL